MIYASSQWVRMSGKYGYHALLHGHKEGGKHMTPNCHCYLELEKFFITG